MRVKLLIALASLVESDYVCSSVSSPSRDCEEKSFPGWLSHWQGCRFGFLFLEVSWHKNQLIN